MTHAVGIGEMKVLANSADTLATYSLGSCVGVTLWDPVARIGGMIHCMLPVSKLNPEKAAERPCMFVDVGLAALLQAVFDLGAERRRLVAKLAGAAAPLDDKGTFRIGERNYTVTRKLLWRNDILIAAEDCGGTKARTMYLYMQDGRTTIRAGGTETEL